MEPPLALWMVANTTIPIVTMTLTITTIVMSRLLHFSRRSRAVFSGVSQPKMDERDARHTEPRLYEIERP